jgi:diguanylate cyclase (GGDEF)-like protein
MRGFSIFFRAVSGFIVFMLFLAAIFVFGPAYIPHYSVYYALAAVFVLGLAGILMMVNTIAKDLDAASDTIKSAMNKEDFVLPRIKGTDKIANLHREIIRLVSAMRLTEHNLGAVKEGAIVNTRLKERRITELEILYDLSRDLKNVYDFNQALSICLDKAVQVLDVQWAGFMIYHEEDSFFTMEHVRGVDADTIIEVRTGILKNNIYKGSRALAFQVLQKNDTFFSHECARNIRFKDFQEFSSLSGPVENFIALPVSNREKRPMGILMGVNKHEGLTFNAGDSGFLKELAHFVFLSCEKVLNFEKAFTDSETGLYIQEYFLQRLREETCLVLRHSAVGPGPGVSPGQTSENRGPENRSTDLERDFSVILFSPDNLDFEGKYASSDPKIALTQLGRKIKEISRIIDIPTCFGEKTFGILMPGTPVKGALVFASRLKEYFENNSISLNKEGLKINLQFSMGLASFNSSCLNDREAETIIKQARQAMDTAFKAGGDRAVCHIEEAKGN